MCSEVGEVNLAGVVCDGEEERWAWCLSREKMERIFLQPMASGTRVLKTSH